MLIAMGGSPGSLAAALAKADDQVTVLDDRYDAEDHAAFLWFRAHKLYGLTRQPTVLGTEFLSTAWQARTRKFHTADEAENYLHDLIQCHVSPQQIHTVARSLNTAGPTALSDRDAIAILAANLVSGRAWVIEFNNKQPKSRFVTKVSPDALTPINARLGTKVDFAFIASLEGDQWLRGYIPMGKGQVIGQSGMTVATGFDVGQWGAKNLQDFGFSKQLIEKLKPYVGVKFKGMTRTAVIERVGKLGPVPQLTKAEADLCDAAVFGAILEDATKLWAKLARHGVPPFTALPAGWQTVWLSRIYQEGAGDQRGNAYAFRDAARNGKWQAAILTLRAYTQYSSRAQQEANLLAKELPTAVVLEK